jgi:signal transduction histidine kinase
VLASNFLLVGLAPDVSFADFAFVTVFAACAWAAGTAMRARHERAQALALMAAEQAVAEERRRIVRELHDVVAPRRCPAWSTSRRSPTSCAAPASR